MERIQRENALNVPNLLTILRMALVPAVVWRYRCGDSKGALMLYLISMLTDAADGFLARRWEQITAIGQLLDPIADKLSLVTLLALFVADGQISPWILGAVLMKEGILVLGSAAALRFGIVVAALPVGKITTLLFVCSTGMRFLSICFLADLFLMCSLILSLAALGWYSVVVFREFQIRKAIA